MSTKGKAITLTAVERHMRQAIQADLDHLFRRRPDIDPGGDQTVLECQLREMLTLEKRALKYGCDIPWRSKDWHGIQVPNDAEDIGQAVPKAAKIIKRKTGNRRTTKGDS